MKRLIQYFGFGMMFVALSCGSAVSRAPAERTSSPTPRAHSVPKYNPTVAEKTRVVTAKRRGTWSLSSDKVASVVDYVAQNAVKYNISEDLLFGIIWVESRFDPRAVSPVGARGLMQLMPQTAAYLAECIHWEGKRDSFDPEFNIAAGSYYISRLVREFKGDEDLALAAYNAGPTKVRRWLAASGLPNVSVEYASMVQTARGFFSQSQASQSPRRVLADATDTAPSIVPPAPVITDEALDRLGLAILIAGFHADDFRAEREDDQNPFN